MKKFIWAIFLLMQLSMLQATWVIVKIDNQSDLLFTRAVRNNDVEIASISQLFQQSQNLDAKIITLDADVFFGSGSGCKIIAKTMQGNQVALAFFGDPTNRVANGRARYADLDSRNAAAAIKAPMLARVFMIENSAMKLIGFAGYENQNQQISLTISGAQGDYKAQLTIIE